jgi:Fe-S-cluster containining protein
MDIITRIYEIYKEIDKTIENFQSATGMRCLDGCAICFREQWVEATVPEVLPLAMEIYLRNQEDDIMKAIAEKEEEKDSVCVIMIKDSPLSLKGSCGLYDVRPFLCRMFGFTARRNKYGELELSPCRIIRDSNPVGLRRAEIGFYEGLNVPVYQDLFMRIASINPSIGFHRLPINQALREAITYIYGMNPNDSGWKEAVNH